MIDIYILSDYNKGSPDEVFLNGRMGITMCDAVSNTVCFEGPYGGKSGGNSDEIGQRRKKGDDARLTNSMSFFGTIYKEVNIYLSYARGKGAHDEKWLNKISSSKSFLADAGTEVIKYIGKFFLIVIKAGNFFLSLARGKGAREDKRLINNLCHKSFLDDMIVFNKVYRRRYICFLEAGFRNVVCMDAGNTSCLPQIRIKQGETHV